MKEASLDLLKERIGDDALAEMTFKHFGHTHYNGNESVAGKGLIIGQTKLVTNQLGYTRRDEQKGYNQKAIITL